MITRQTRLEDIAKFFHKVICSCGAMIGQYHLDGCDVARCRNCGDQAWASDCGKWKPDVWTGWWPGTVECIQNNLWCRWGPPWIPCNIDHPEATPDLNELFGHSTWSKKENRYIYHGTRNKDTV